MKVAAMRCKRDRGTEARFYLSAVLNLFLFLGKNPIFIWGLLTVWVQG